VRESEPTSYPHKPSLGKTKGKTASQKRVNEIVGCQTISKKGEDGETLQAPKRHVSAAGMKKKKVGGKSTA